MGVREGGEGSYLNTPRTRYEQLPYVTDKPIAGGLVEQREWVCHDEEAKAKPHDRPDGRIYHRRANAQEREPKGVAESCEEDARDLEHEDKVEAVGGLRRTS